MASKGTKIFLIILAVLAVIVIIIAVVLWKVGVFATPEIVLGQKGPYHYVYVDRTGPFSEIPQGYKQADSLIRKQNIETGIACGSYLDNPSKVDQKDLRWRIGYIVADSIEVTEPLTFLTIPNHQYLIATIKAHPMIAPFKTYPAMEKWIAERTFTIVGPAYEFYNEDGVIEVLFPVKPKEE